VAEICLSEQICLCAKNDVYAQDTHGRGRESQKERLLDVAYLEVKARAAEAIKTIGERVDT